MNKYSNDYYLNGIFDYNEIYYILTLMNLETNEKTYKQCKNWYDFYALIFSEDNKTLRITPAKDSCYTCTFAEECECIVYDDCDDGRDFCKAELRALEMLDYYVRERLSEESIFFVDDCLGCPVCSRCLG